jgi:hypothetical protein
VSPGGAEATKAGHLRELVGLTDGHPGEPAAASFTLAALSVWEIVLMLVLLKIPVAYVAWVIWWAIKAEPEIGAQGGTDSVNWKPWRRPSPSGSPVRTYRGGRYRTRDGVRSRGERRHERVGRIRA